jgi:acetyltransferase-like isoleucine patch superfamily enzyme
MEAGSPVNISSTARLLFADRLDCGRNVAIMDFAVIGLPNQYQDIFSDDGQRRVKLGDDVVIYPMATIYEGVTIESGVILEERTTVGSLSRIGSRSRIVYHAQVNDKVIVGDDCVIGGFIADNTKVGNRCSIFGALVHTYRTHDPRTWDAEDEVGPTIGDDVLIGWGAVIVGDVTIGAGAYVYPNAVVTRDIPAGQRFYGYEPRGENREY